MKRKLIILFSTVLIAVIIIVAVIFSIIALNRKVQPKAVIVDNLALMPLGTYNNQDFVKNATKILNDIGLEVDYFPLDKVTVNLYRSLGSYLVVILRVHSGILKGSADVYLFTSESIQKVRKYLQYGDKYLGNACIPTTQKCYIAVSPNFIRDFSENFRNSVIIAMGCDSLKTSSLAKVFVEKGASVYIGWKHKVTPKGTDNATLELLKRLFIENMTVSKAVKGLEDSVTFAELDFYPRKAENLRPLSMIKKLVSVESSASVNIYCLISNKDVFDVNLTYRRIFRTF